MLRIGSMNMLLHGVENPDIRYRDSLAQDHAGEEEKYTLVLANPPFAGSLDYENTAKDLLQIVKTKKTELLFLALFLRLLKPGGRAAVIVPDGVLFGSSNAHKTCGKFWSRTRSSMPSSRSPAECSNPTPASPPRFSFSPRPTPAARTTSGSTTWTPTACRSTTNALRYCLKINSVPRPVPVLDPGVRRGDEDGHGDDRHSGEGRNPVLTPEEHAKNNLPDILTRWRSLQTHSLAPSDGQRTPLNSLAPSEGERGQSKREPLAAEDPAEYGGEFARKRTEQSFLVSKAGIAAQGYDLSINRYKEVVHEEIAHRAPGEILASLAKLETEIQQGMTELDGMLK